MSDDIYIMDLGRDRTEYVTKTVNVTEKRAPTDESVRLLKEMEEAARSKIEDTFVLTNNGFECRIYTVLECNSYDYIITAVYLLNGKKMRSEARISKYDLETAGYEKHQKLFQAIQAEVAMDIAREILGPAYMASLKSGDITA